MKVPKHKTYLALAVLLAAAAGAQEISIKVDVRLVNILATVKDEHGALVPNLVKEDFVVLEEGRPQEIRIFDREAGMPVAIAMLLDASLSTAKDLKLEQESGARFLHSLMRPQDRAALFAFTHDVYQLTEFTSDVARLEKAIRIIRPAGGTSLYDAIFVAAGQLKPRQGRKVMVLVTDGGDTTSTLDYHQALHAAQQADAVIYSVIIVPIPSEAGRNIGGEHALITLSEGTGGRAFQPRAAADLDPVFREIEAELRTQYVLGFYPRTIPGADSYRRLEVRTANRSFTVQARKGYYFREELP